MVVRKLCNLSTVCVVDAKSDNALSFLVGTLEYAVNLGDRLDVQAELEKLEADLQYQEGFLQSVIKKLSNSRFVDNAPAAVIDRERKKQADAESKIASLKENIASLKGSR